MRQRLVLRLELAPALPGSAGVIRVGGRLELRNIEAQLWEGDIKGTANIPLGSAESWDTDLQLHAINLEHLVRAVPSVKVKVSGRVDGTAHGSFVAERPGQPRRPAAQIKLNAPQIRVQGIAVNHFEGVITYRGGEGKYELQGDTIAGPLHLESQLTPAATAVKNGP